MMSNLERSESCIDLIIASSLINELVEIADITLLVHYYQSSLCCLFLLGLPDLLDEIMFY